MGREVISKEPIVVGVKEYFNEITKDGKHMIHRYDRALGELVNTYIVSVLKEVLKDGSFGGWEEFVESLHNIVEAEVAQRIKELK